MAKHSEGLTNAEQHGCCVALDEAAVRYRDKRQARRNRPLPWVLLKLCVAITAAMMAYAFYVYVARLCVPMIRRQRGAFGSRGLGVAFLVVFCVLWLMMLWAYVTVCTVSPGKARDFVNKTASPPKKKSNSATPPWWDAEDGIGSEPYTPPPPPRRPRHTKRARSSRENDTETTTAGSRPSKTSNPQETADQDQNHSHHSRQELEGRKVENGGSGSGDGGPEQTVRPVPDRRASSSRPSPSSRSTAAAQPETEPTSPKPRPYHADPLNQPETARKPPSYSELLPENRYCHADEIVKPYRAHHCRACGTCILKYDHHCPWIGQCVGAHNHKFFVNFLEWALVFCLWTFSTLLAENIKAGHRPDASPDAQEIIILALTALFSFFTSVMLMAHLNVLLLNQTTVESIGSRAMKERESEVLAKLHPWHAFGAKARTKREWNAEWGRIGREGNLWYMGSVRGNWESVMGRRVYEWFLPVGRSPVDGLSYMPNPRFDPEGRWRPRREWPAELQ